MIRITHSPAQAKLARQIRDDLSDGFAARQPVLIVLVSAQSVADPAVLAEIERAQHEGARIIPLLTAPVGLPPALRDLRSLNFAAGYQRESLRRRLSQETMTPVDARQANRQALTVIGAIALIMFALAILGIGSGLVAFPVAEYNEEATFQAQWIDGLIGETLQALQPSAGLDGQDFAATLAAAPTRLYYYIRGTATAMPGAGGA